MYKWPHESPWNSKEVLLSKKFPIFSPEIWAVVGQESDDLSRASKKYKLGQRILDVNVRYL